MRKALQTMLADTPLVKNLDNFDYMKVLLDGKENLEEIFAEIGKSFVRENEGLFIDADRILPEFRTIASLPALPEKLIQLLTGIRDTVKSN
jgi:hypothetical protein